MIRTGNCLLSLYFIHLLNGYWLDSWTIEWLGSVKGVMLSTLCCLTAVRVFRLLTGIGVQFSNIGCSPCE
jgi:hypothetical protein